MMSAGVVELGSGSLDLNGSLVVTAPVSRTGSDSCRRSIRSASSGFAEFCPVLLGPAPDAA
jgi:hypothetical protein